MCHATIQNSITEGSLSGVKSLTSEATPSATQFFKRSYKIRNNPGLQASLDSMRAHQKLDLILVQVNLFQKLATSAEHVVYQNCS